ncbi:MAG: sialate O-acetylesterase [Pseudodesulfovibrio sp.]
MGTPRSRLYGKGYFYVSISTIAILLACLLFLIVRFNMVESLMRKVTWQGLEPYAVTEGREPVPLALDSGIRRMTTLVFGQSNAANRTPSLIAGDADVYNFFQGTLYKALDPLLGTDGLGGTVWTRLGNLIVRQGLFDEVVLVPVARGGSSMADWAPGGLYHEKLGELLDQVRASGLTITHVLWQQGESDAFKLKTPPATYQEQFLAMLGMLRAKGVDAPVFVAISTVCASVPYEPLRKAQMALARSNAGIFEGPDMDSLDCTMRQPDNCHFNDRGADAAAELWLRQLESSLSLRQ